LHLAKRLVIALTLTKNRTIF